MTIFNFNSNNEIEMMASEAIKIINEGLSTDCHIYKHTSAKLIGLDAEGKEIKLTKIFIRHTIKHRFDGENRIR